MALGFSVEICPVTAEHGPLGGNMSCGNMWKPFAAHIHLPREATYTLLEHIDELRRTLKAAKEATGEKRKGISTTCM